MLTPLNEPRAGSPQQEMGNGNISQFAFDHKTEPGREVSFQQHAVNVTRVVGYHDAVMRGQVLHTGDLDPDAWQDEYGSRRERSQPIPSLFTGHEDGKDQGEQNGQRKACPGVCAPDEMQAACDAVHVMSTPSTICDSHHAG